MGQETTSVSFHIPARGEVNRRLRAWVDSFEGQSRRQRSAAIREAIYQYHLAEREDLPAELQQLLHQQTALLMHLNRLVEQIQSELERLQGTGVIEVTVEDASSGSTANEQKLKQLTRKFF